LQNAPNESWELVRVLPEDAQDLEIRLDS
jgi:hypothetical protein